MRRRLFTILSAVSLLLCVAIAAGWVGSYFAYVHVADGSLSRPTAFVGRSFQGKLHLERRSYWGYEPGWTVDRRRIRRGDVAGEWWYQTPSIAHTFLGFGMYSGTCYIWPEYLYPGVAMPLSLSDPRFRRDKYVGLAVPYWAILAIFIVLTLWLNAKRPRPRKIGFCPTCGYDLRATPDCCPECGAVPAKVAGPA